MLMRRLVYMFFPLSNTSRFQTTIVGTGTRCTGAVWFRVSPTYCRTLPSHGCYHKVVRHEDFHADQQPPWRSLPRPQVQEYHSSLPGCT
ncbi:hypothetical protein PISMIDRAFT_230636 [Pisolithus microcarpus 441]|uniref:Uncharacterized protein n=1 Tax=Pisolithus microcarpus 441 TaxID=765257 RepID=A0A0C9ZBK5_9AGAM|nr:hypothetical protein BKA83DRAFT_230636 [Pisolithus microcarpus]KIK17303.1 hypothetical protein PISMIDRAFT_230636 [Pisolithus microcarpus 441]